MKKIITRIRQSTLRVIFSIFAQISPEWRFRLKGSSLHGLYIKIVTPLSSGLSEQEFEISSGPLNGYKILLDPDGWERRYIFGEYEPTIVNVVSELCKPGMIVIDIGAHYGYFSMIMAKLVGPGGRCIAFEPSPGNCEHINYAIKANNIKNLEVFDAAVGDFDGITDFVLEESGFMGHMIDKGGWGRI